MCWGFGLGFGLGVSKFAEDIYLVNSPFESLVGCGDVCCCMCFDCVFHMFAAGWWFGLVGQLGGGVVGQSLRGLWVCGFPFKCGLVGGWVSCFVCVVMVFHQGVWFVLWL